METVECWLLAAFKKREEWWEYQALKQWLQVALENTVTTDDNTCPPPHFSLKADRTEAVV